MSGLAVTLIAFTAAGASLPPAVEKPILRAATELETPGAVRPSRLLTRTILGTMNKDDVRNADACIDEQSLKRRDYAALLSAVRIHNRAERTLWFVRPSVDRYCSAFYGAHLFRYYFIEQIGPPNVPRYRILFENRGDGFAVYANLSHGVNDIEATGCISSGCRSARLSFDGHQYRISLCKRISFDGHGGELARKRRCGSDEFSDMQATGLANEQEHIPGGQR